LTEHRFILEIGTYSLSWVLSGLDITCEFDQRAMTIEIIWLSFINNQDAIMIDKWKDKQFLRNTVDAMVLSFPSVARFSLCVLRDLIQWESDSNTYLC
jgi:hypothetical protein